MGGALLLWVTLGAAGAELDQAVERVQQTYRQAGDLEARFTQVFVDQLRGKRREESGRLWAKADGRVRWSYLTPVRKEFIYDGESAYFYEPANAQVTVFERFADSPLANALRFLWGQGNIRDTFRLAPCAAGCEIAQANELAVELWPKQEIPTVDHSLLVIDRSTWRVRASVVIDPLGNRNEYHFADLRFAVKVDPAKFDFVVPKGVSVLRPTLEEPQPPAKRPPAGQGG